MPGPLVDTGSVVARECDAEEAVGEGLAVGEGDGEGRTIGGREGDTPTGWTGAGATMFGGGIVAEVSREYWLTA